MAMDKQFFASQWPAALSYDDYVRTGTEEQQRRWRQVFDVVRLADKQSQLIRSFSRDVHVLVVSGIWCGDCVQQCPLMHHIAMANPQRIHLRFVDRDAHRELSQQLKINGGDRVPVAIFLAEDFELCSIYGERTLNRYRTIARRQLGPACEIAIAPPDADEIAATLQDWLDEFERIQLLLRLSPRLRQKHGD
ncbi:MAG: thioredoxin family protein [Phycisphaerae bacterium]|nr:thioredoxin family protein [Phycisphaerae bacterium]